MEPEETAPQPVSRAVGVDLLALFSPKICCPAAPGEDGADARMLWETGALHRARNLAQMSIALSSDGLAHLHGYDADMKAAEAHVLAHAYTELGRDDPDTMSVPCAALLKLIATRLMTLFASGSGIVLTMAIDPVSLSPVQRRALILIASELIINALKYAFDPGGAGQIQLALRRTGNRIAMTVADNGRGIAKPIRTGGGHGLMTQFVKLLGAEMRHTDNAPGLSVTISLPVPKT